MPTFDLKFITKADGPAWPDLMDRSAFDLYIVGEGGGHGEPLQMAVLEDGMASGKPSVAIRCNLSDGRHVIIQTSARLFCSAARAIMAKYPDLFVGDD